jgi:uncharacterized protein YndB with AHSA1/START domain
MVQRREGSAVRLREIHVRRLSSASPEALYRLLADGSTWPRWSPVESVDLEQEGDPPPEGVGGIRVLHRGRTTGRDQILELVPDRTFKYATLSGVPVRNYVGQIDLEPAPGGGTAIHWHSSFFPKTRGTGWLLQRGIGRFLEQCTEGLAEYAASTQNA